MPIDSTNSQAFAKRIMDAVLDTLAKQADQKQHVEIEGKFIVNPQTFKTAHPSNTLTTDTSTMTASATQRYLSERGQDKRHYVTGLIKLTATFSSPPHITFGQVPEAPRGDQGPPGAADAFVPFLVEPYVHAWHNTGAMVDGFYLGLYALTAPHSGTSQHTIHWKISGRGSRYKGRGQDDLWSKSYDYSKPGFLTDTSN